MGQVGEATVKVHIELDEESDKLVAALKFLDDGSKSKRQIKKRLKELESQLKRTIAERDDALLRYNSLRTGYRTAGQYSYHGWPGYNSMTEQILKAEIADLTRQVNTLKQDLTDYKELQRNWRLLEEKLNACGVRGVFETIDMLMRPKASHLRDQVTEALDLPKEVSTESIICRIREIRERKNSHTLNEVKRLLCLPQNAEKQQIVNALSYQLSKPSRGKFDRIQRNWRILEEKLDCEGVYGVFEAIETLKCDLNRERGKASGLETRLRQMESRVLEPDVIWTEALPYTGTDCSPPPMVKVSKATWDKTVAEKTELESLVARLRKELAG